MIGFFVPESMRGMVAAKLWMIDNQNGQWESSVKAHFGGAFGDRQAAKLMQIAANKLLIGVASNGEILTIIDKTKHNTQKTIANDLGWSAGKVAP